MKPGGKWGRKIGKELEVTLHISSCSLLPGKGTELVVL